MIHLIRQPPPVLAAHIEYFWYHDGLDWGWERLLPDGAIELVIDLTDGAKRWADNDMRAMRTVRGSWISGQQSRPIAVEAAAGSRMIGAHFRPGGASAFLRQPVLALNDAVTELDHLWGAFASELRERLLAANGADAAFALLESSLAARLAGAPPADRRVAFAVRRLQAADDTLSMRRLAGAVGMSERRFSDLFQRHVGLAPKLFSRVMRLQRVLRDVEHARSRSWTRVAADHGYFDHSHMTRDFVALIGMTPTAYAARRGPEPNWIAFGD